MKRQSFTAYRAQMDRDILSSSAKTCEWCCGRTTKRLVAIPIAGHPSGIAQINMRLCARCLGNASRVLNSLKALFYGS